MSMEEYDRFGAMKLYFHQIYELKKGVRHLVLCTMSGDCARLLIDRLESQHIDYVEQPAGAGKVNLYFGRRQCLDVVRSFHSQATAPAHSRRRFHAGVMLGYDLTMQCERFWQPAGRPPSRTVSGGCLVKNEDRKTETTSKCVIFV